MFADAQETDRPGIEECYERATNASNLKQDPERRTAADVLRDMAMSPNRVGAALMRLRAQWEASEKPTRQHPRTVKQFLAVGLKREEAEAAHSEEKTRYEAWFVTATERLLTTLTELPSVRDALTVQALKWGMQDPQTKAAATVRYWLDQTCPRCSGLKFLPIPGSPGLSTKLCPHPRDGGCGGSGFATVPHKEDGKRLANYLDLCVGRYKQHNRNRRKALESIPPIERLSKRAQKPYNGPDPEAD